MTTVLFKAFGDLVVYGLMFLVGMVLLGIVGIYLYEKIEEAIDQIDERDRYFDE